MLLVYILDFIVETEKHNYVLLREGRPNGLVLRRHSTGFLTVYAQKKWENAGTVFRGTPYWGAVVFGGFTVILIYIRDCSLGEGGQEC